MAENKVLFSIAQYEPWITCVAFSSLFLNLRNYRKLLVNIRLQKTFCLVEKLPGV